MRLFQDGVILIPFRHPLDQAESLLRQHRRFLDIHGREAFSRQYMEDIGHLEFGELHRPIQFEGTSELTGLYSKNTLEYWIAYWVVAFTHVLRHEDQVVMVSYEKCCADVGSAVVAIAQNLAVGRDELLEALGELVPVAETLQQRG